MNRWLNLLIVLLALLAGLALHARNAALVEFDYYAGTLQVPLSWLIAATLIAGFLLGLLASLLTVLRLKARIRALDRRNAAISREVANLRTLPVKDVG